MILYSLLCRLYDGLPLVADSCAEPTLADGVVADVASVCQRLADDARIPRDTPALIIADAPFMFYVLAQNGVCACALCDVSTLPPTVFAFLDELISEFVEHHGPKADLVVRPYCFLAFDERLQELKKMYATSSASSRIMPSQLANLPEPHRVPIEVFLQTSPRRQLSSSRRSSPTTAKSAPVVSSPVQLFPDAVSEFTGTVGGAPSLLAEVLALAREYRAAILVSTVGLSIFTTGLFFLVAFLFE